MKWFLKIIADFFKQMLRQMQRVASAHPPFEKIYTGEKSRRAPKMMTSQLNNIPNQREVSETPILTFITRPNIGIS